MNKDTALHSIAMYASKAFVDSNIPEYLNNKNGYSLLVSDLTARYIEAYNIAEKEFSKSKIQFDNTKHF